MMLRAKTWRSPPIWRRSGFAFFHDEPEEPFTYEQEQRVSDEWTKDKTIAKYIEQEERYDEAPQLISFLQRSKNILSSHWRCQLSTVHAAARSDPFHISLVDFGFFQKPYVCLNTQDQLHKTNLLNNSNVTIIVGHCDPPPLMETIKLLNKVPPHVIVSGILGFAPDNEVTMVKEGIETINSQAKEVVEIGGHALRPIFESAKSILEAQFESRKNMLSPENELSVYMLRPNTCHYVDIEGEKHEVDILQGHSPCFTPFAALFAGIVEGVNQNDSMRFALKAICMVQRHVNVEEALLYSVDRTGFDVFAKVIGRKASSWKGFRFNFAKRVNDAIGVCRELIAMEHECWKVMKNSPALEALVSNAAFKAAEVQPDVRAEVNSEDDIGQAEESEAKDAEQNENEEEGETARLIDLL